MSVASARVWSQAREATFEKVHRVTILHLETHSHTWWTRSHGGHQACASCKKSQAGVQPTTHMPTGIRWQAPGDWGLALGIGHGGGLEETGEGYAERPKCNQFTNSTL